MKQLNTFRKILYLVLISFYCLLTACAESGVSRSASDKIDYAYQRGSDSVHTLGNNDLPAYPNSSTIAQSAVAGGAAGAIAGAVWGGSSGVLPGAAGGAVVGGILGSYFSQYASLKDQIENRGGKVFILGDQIMIVLPSDQTFRPGSQSIYPQAYPTLDLVAEFLNHYVTMAVRVTAYEDRESADRVNLAVSKQQAETVVKYLWRKVNTRMIYAVGMGDCHLVSKEGSAINNRIEITTEKLPA